LSECGDTVLNIDYRKCGLGSASCRPEPLEKYKLKAEEAEFKFKMRPFSRNSWSEMNLSKQVFEEI